VSNVVLDDGNLLFATSASFAYTVAVTTTGGLGTGWGGQFAEPGGAAGHAEREHDHNEGMSMKLGKKLLVGIAKVSLASIALAGALAGYLVYWHDQPLVLPSPTGAYHVGRTEFDWVDDNRIDPLSDQANEKRELLVWVWYPAATSEQDTAVPYVPPAGVNARDVDQGIGRFIESDFSSIQTHSYANAPISETEGAYPVIIMQPGMGPVPTDYTVFAENLASHGYVVVGINPTYTSNVIVFPDGRVALRMAKGTIPDNANAAAADQDASRIGKVWTEDAIFVMDQLRRLDTDPASLFYNKLDLAHIGLFGHSFGGATTASVCKIDARCQAGADLDGTLFSYQADGTLQRPFLFMAEDACGKDCETMRQAYSASISAAYYLSIKGTRHFNFSDLPLRLSPLARFLFNKLGYIGSIQPERGLAISNAYLVAFFDQYLKGANSELLQSPSSAYPDVQFEKR
jgi:predicted dienelactone hydrolase